MTEITEDQFGILCVIYNGDKVFLLPEDEALRDMGLVVPIGAEDGLYELTGEAKAFMEDKGRELAKPDFGSLSASEKKVIVRTRTFPDEDHRRLLFDSDETVASVALYWLDITEEEFIRLGDSPFPAVRGCALKEGREFLRDGRELDRKLSRYLKHEDADTVEAVLKALRFTGNIGFVGEDRINRWFESDIPDPEVVRLLCENGVKVPDGTIASLVAGRDPEVLDAVSRHLQDRLDHGQIDTILDEGTPHARVEVALQGTNLTSSQVKRLTTDSSQRVRWAFLHRLNDLAKKLNLVEDDPELIGSIRNGSIPGHADM